MFYHSNTPPTPSSAACDIDNHPKNSTLEVSPSTQFQHLLKTALLYGRHSFLSWLSICTSVIKKKIIERNTPDPYLPNQRQPTVYGTPGISIYMQSKSGSCSFRSREVHKIFFSLTDIHSVIRKRNYQLSAWEKKMNHLRNNVLLHIPQLVCLSIWKKGFSITMQWL